MTFDYGLLSKAMAEREFPLHVQFELMAQHRAFASALHIDKVRVLAEATRLAQRYAQMATQPTIDKAIGQLASPEVDIEQLMLRLQQATSSQLDMAMANVLLTLAHAKLKLQQLSKRLS